MQMIITGLQSWLVPDGAGLMERRIGIDSWSNPSFYPSQPQSGLWVPVDRLTVECVAMRAWATITYPQKVVSLWNAKNRIEHGLLDLLIWIRSFRHFERDQLKLLFVTRFVEGTHQYLR
jgi:hypothetical protein